MLTITELERRRKIGVAVRERYRNPNYRQKMSKIMNSKSYKTKMSKIQKEIQNRPDVKKKNIEMLKKKWKDPEFAKRIVRSCAKHTEAIERLQLLEGFDTVLKRGHPDCIFINPETKKVRIVEVKDEKDRITFEQKSYMNFYQLFAKGEYKIEFVGIVSKQEADRKLKKIVTEV